MFINLTRSLVTNLYKATILAISINTAALASAAESKCIDCHQKEVNSWQQSDHAKAMAVASDKTVLGNFNNIQATHYSQKARFFKDDSKYLIEFTENNSSSRYEVQYTFGHYPLQQYLIKADKGKLQVFPFAWDSRSKKEGGQRWYPIYANEDIQLNDRLHWQQPLQNWNGMCADCHSDGLKRQFDANTNSFQTTWDNINVGCQSCHGKLSKSHYDKAKDSERKPKTALIPAFWLHSPEHSVAKWHGSKRDNSFMDNCFACHSLRSPLTDGFDANKPFLDQFSPSLLQAPLYHADGQIKDEVYVYGSFLQSKMYKAGVNCIDCHDKHTMKVKVQGNGLCLQCHNAEVYQQQAHFNHPIESDATQCVSCHMPTKRYMGVDDRRDHSFKVPRPALSAQYSTPNACNSCHQDKDTQWAIDNVSKLWGNHHKLSPNALALIELQNKLQLPLDKHLAIINDESLTELERASAIALLPNSTQMLNDFTVSSWVNSELPLIRLATAKVGFLLPTTEREKSFKQLVTDKFKAIRVQAIQHFLMYSEQQIPGYNNALEELTISNYVSKWRGEGGLNASMMHIGLKQYQPAISALKQAIEVDPYFEAPYVNLADLYRSISEISKEHSTLRAGIRAIPKSGILHYSYGLSLVRHGQKSKAIEFLKKAQFLKPDNVQYAYAYWVALDGEGQTEVALKMMLNELVNYNNDNRLIELGLYFAQKTKDINSFIKLKQIHK